MEKQVKLSEILKEIDEEIEKVHSCRDTVTVFITGPLHGTLKNLRQKIISKYQ